MIELTTLGAVTSGLLGYYAVEQALHARRLNRIPVRIHVNGTRGKSSVTRLIAAGLRGGGVVACAKTTGTLPRMILPDGRELPVFRPSGANIREQIRIVSVAEAFQAQALVLECMALQPILQWVSENKLVRATHGVITNARPDHLDVMGPGPEDVAKALCGMVPVKGVLYTNERQHLDILRMACDDRETRLVALPQEEIDAVTAEDMAGFVYREHAENVALALRICADLEVDRSMALQAMWDATPDSGAMTERHLDFFGRKVSFINGFAANDPVSTEQIWHMWLERCAERAKRIIIMNCRADRVDRSVQLGRAIAGWPVPDHVVLVGTGTTLFAREAVRAGFEPTKLISAEAYRVEQIFEMVMEMVEREAMVIGMGNIGGPGLELVRYFNNRAAPPERRQVRGDLG